MTRPAVQVPVSVCMATYNGASWVRAQVDSVLAQLGPEDELVVVDDASRDDTVAILRAVDDDRLRLEVADVNRGYVRTFERALELARGEHVVLADQDDIWVEGRLAAMRAALDAGADVVATNLATLDGPDRIRGPYGQADWHLRAAHSGRRVRNVVGVLAGNRPYYGCAMAVRRSVLTTALPFPPFLDESHDLWLALHGNILGRMRHLELRSVRRRFHGDNTSPDRPRGVRLVLRSRFMLLRAVAELLRRRSRG